MNDEFDRLVAQQHKAAADRAQQELGQGACPDLIKIKAWTHQIDDAVTKLMRTLYCDPGDTGGQNG
jgi:hypothetical protein